MLQRIQTLLLLAALALLLLVLFFPLIYLSEGTQIYCYESRPLLVLSVVGTLGLAATICLYKARMVQIRICIFTAVVLIGLQGWIGYYLFFDRIPGATFSMISVFPVAAAILTLLAIRYIGRDEAIVRSYHRLRG